MAIDRVRHRIGEWAVAQFQRRFLGPVRSGDSSYQAQAKAAAEIDAAVSFHRLIQSRKVERVVEFGTAQAVPGHSSHSLALFPGLDRSQYTMVDIKPGPDVDVVADLHSLPAEWMCRFDVCIANAVFEHLARPWVAAREMARILTPGGICHVATHQTFPLHGYPKDYFRFSTDALALIFADAGFEVVETGYGYRTKIILPEVLLAASQVDAWNKEFPSYAIVAITAKKS